jgi:hypothetical protein
MNRVCCRSSGNSRYAETGHLLARYARQTGTAAGATPYD